MFSNKDTFLGVPLERAVTLGSSTVMEDQTNWKKCLFFLQPFKDQRGY